MQNLFIDRTGIALYLIKLLNLFIVDSLALAVQLSIQPFYFCLKHAFPFLVLCNIPLQMVHLPLIILLALQVDPLVIFNQPLQLCNSLLQHLAFLCESHVFLVEVAVVEGQFVEFLGVEVALVGDLLSFFEDAGVELLEFFLSGCEFVFVGLAGLYRCFQLSNQPAVSLYLLVFVQYFRLQIYIFLLQCLKIFAYFGLLVLQTSTIFLQLINNALLPRDFHLRCLQFFLLALSSSITALFFGIQRRIIALFDLIVLLIEPNILADGIIAALFVLIGHVFVLEVNSLIDILGEAEYLIAGVDHVLILDEMIECVDIWCAIEQNSSSV